MGGFTYHPGVDQASAAPKPQAKETTTTEPILAQESRVTIKPTANQIAHQQQIKQEAEQAQVEQAQAQQKAQAEQVQAQQVQATQVQNAPKTTAQSVTTQPTTSQNVVQQAVTSSVGLFRFLGHSFGLQNFSGGGGAQVPGTPYVYRWTQSSTPWYLVEQSGSAGAYIQGVGLGDKVEIDGRTYTVTDIARHLPSQAGTSGAGSVAGAYYEAHRHQHAAGFQTCDNSYYETLWFLD